MTSVHESHVQPPPAGKAASSWRWVRIALVVAMLGGLILVAKPRQLWSALSAAEWVWLAVAIPFGFVAIFFDAMKLYLLIIPHGYRGGWGAVLRTTLVVNFVSLFLPGTVGGGAVAWYRLSKPDGLRAQAFTAVTLNALIKAIVICGVGAAALSADALAGEAQRRMALPLAVLAGIAGIFFLLLTMTGLAAWINRAPMTSLGRVLPGMVHGALTRIIGSVDTYRRFKASVIGALVAGVARKLVENVCFMLALRAVGVEAGYMRVLWIMCAVEASGMIPLTLGGWGLPQVTYVGLFAALGVASDLSLASQVVAWAIFLPVYLLGAILLLGEAAQEKKARTP